VTKQLYKCKPPIRAAEWSIEQGGGAYIYFEEFMSIPGLENADIRIEFDRNNSFTEICDLVSKLKSSGFTFVVRK